MELGFSLGSNLGDRLAYLRDARQALLAFPGTGLLAQSPVYETEPVGVKPEYAEMPYLNAVLVVESEDPAQVWLERLGQIETALGRVRTGDRFAPRTIDIDILYAGDEVIDSGGLVVPHPRWATRRFVLQPLADLRPQLVLPGSGQCVEAILRQLPPGEKVRKLGGTW